MKNKSKTAHFLILSGGAFRGALQHYVVEDLISRYNYRLIAGTSIGATVGTMASMDKLPILLEFWKSMDGKGKFLRFRFLYLLAKITGLVFAYKKLSKLSERFFAYKFPRVLGGVYSLRPFEKKLYKYIELDKLSIPFVAGVVSGDTGEYYNLDAREMTSNKELVDAILGSSCMMPIMKPHLLQLEPDKKKEAGFDGGYRNIFPIPYEEIAEAKAEGKRIVIHAVGCTPFDRIKEETFEEMDDEIEQILRGVELFEDEIYRNDILQLRSLVGKSGKVKVWRPSYMVGSSFDASAETIEERLAESKKMIDAGPLVFKGLE